MASEGKARSAESGGARTGVILAFFGTLLGATLLMFRRTDRSHAAPSGRGDPGIPPSPQSVATGYEHVDATTSSVVKAVVILASYAAGMVGLMVVMLNIFDASTTRRDANLTAEQRTPIQVPSPHLQAAPYVELHDERSRENGKLDGYAWLGADHARARIPLERAMALTVGRSLDFGPDGPPAAGGTAPADTGSGHP